MSSSKRKISLQPIPTHLSKGQGNSIKQVQRALTSIKGAGKPLSSSPSPSFLPPIRRGRDSKRSPSHQNMLKPRKAQQKLSFDEQILTHRSQKGIYQEHSKQGLSRQALLQRKESHLNTYFNLRKQQLVEITKANRRIYQRINSQTSLYSSKHLDRSCDSSLSRRLSQSKLSKLSSMNSLDSLASSRTGKEEKTRGEAKKRKSIKIEPQDINTVEVDKMYRYLSIFCNHLNVKPPMQQSKKQQLPSSNLNPADKENRQTMHRPKLSKNNQQNCQIDKRRINLQLARRL